VSLTDPRVASVLDRLHAEARGDRFRMIGMLPTFVWGRVRGRTLMESITPESMKAMYIPVTREEGQFLHFLAKSIGARRIVEFGCSFGISTVYLAAAARDLGGSVITTEIETGKIAATRANLQEAGLDGTATVLAGDALETLKSVEGPIDLVFLDGWKNLYVPVFELLRSRIRPGGIVIGDNVEMPDTKPWVELTKREGFESTLLFNGRMLVSRLP
jgi:predicted O-methyltransferase YrrM